MRKERRKKEGREEKGKERRGGRKGKTVGDCGYRGAEFLVLESKGIRLPWVVAALLLDKCFVQNLI